MEVVLDQSNKRKEDTAERHTVAAQRNEKGSRKNPNVQIHIHFGLKKNKKTFDISCFFLSHSLKMIWLNLAAMLACLALRTVKWAR